MHIDHREVAPHMRRVTAVRTAPRRPHQFDDLDDDGGGDKEDGGGGAARGGACEPMARSGARSPTLPLARSPTLQPTPPPTMPPTQPVARGSAPPADAHIDRREVAPCIRRVATCSPARRAVRAAPKS